MEFKFEHFSRMHIQLIIFALLLFLVFMFIHSKISASKLVIYATYLGYALLLLKIFDSLNLHYSEGKPWAILLPLHICNISLISGSIYLITKKEIFFDITYFLSFGAIIAIVMPDWNTYNSVYYPYVYYTTHIFEYIILYFGFSRMGIKIDNKHYMIVCIIIAGIMISAGIINILSPQMNFMFLNTYAINSLSFIKPLWLYRIIVVITYYLLTYIMYLLLRVIHKNK